MKSDNIDSKYKILRIIDENPEYTQRRISQELGYSVGKVNYVIAALVDKGFLKLNRFIKSKNKFVYRYILTPKGIKEKYRITKDFLRRKIQEYDALQKEIQEAKYIVKAHQSVSRNNND